MIEEKLPKPSGPRTVAQAILEQLQLWGVKRIYGVVGDAIFGLLDAIARQENIQFIAVKHESVAALMASAEAKCTGRIGVCAAQMGPGLANIINGLGDAYLDRSPVLAITGQAPLNKIGTPYKQYINQQELVQAVTGYSQLVVHPDAVINALTQAIHTSITMDIPSHLSIPADIFTMPTHAQPNKPIQMSAGDIEEGQVAQALSRMRSAKQPMILMGNGARSAVEEVKQLAEVWGSGIAMGYGAAGIIPESFSYALGGLGEGGNPYLADLFKQADVVLVIGTSWWPEGITPIRTYIIQLEKSHHRLGIGIPTNCGLIGQSEEIVPQLIKGLKEHAINPMWVEEIQQCKQIWLDQNESEGNKEEFPLHPARIIRAIEKNCTPETIITLDEGDSTLWFLRNFRTICKQVVLSAQWRTMGFGLPAAMAAKFSYPHHPVLCVTGDGGLGMVLADLLTAVRYQLQITVIVLNNGRLQMENNKMKEKGFLAEGTELTNPDFVKIAEACGWLAFRIQSAAELEHLLQTAGDRTKPVLLEVPTAQVPYPNYPNTD